MCSKLIDEIEKDKKVDWAAAKHHEVLEKWAEINPSERQEILGIYIRFQIGKAIGIDPSEIDMQQSVKYLGIDSLIAVKLRNQLRSDWSVDLAAVKFLDDFSLCDLAVLLEEQIRNMEPNSWVSDLALEKEAKDKDWEPVTEINDGDWLEGEI